MNVPTQISTHIWAYVPTDETMPGGRMVSVTLFNTHCDPVRVEVRIGSGYVFDVDVPEVRGNNKVGASRLLNFDGPFGCHVFFLPDGEDVVVEELTRVVSAPDRRTGVR
jgi:hypothetical protein